MSGAQELFAHGERLAQQSFSLGKPAKILEHGAKAVEGNRHVRMLVAKQLLAHGQRFPGHGFSLGEPGFALEHARQVVTDSIIKAPALPGGGVLIDTSGPFANIVLGQDMMAGFVGPEPARYRFAIFESVALWVRVPEAVCVLK